jgi:hypothetical protein
MGLGLSDSGTRLRPGNFGVWQVYPPGLASQPTRPCYCSGLAGTARPGYYSGLVGTARPGYYSGLVVTRLTGSGGYLSDLVTVHTFFFFFLKILN